MTTRTGRTRQLYQTLCRMTTLMNPTTAHSSSAQQPHALLGPEVEIVRSTNITGYTNFGLGIHTPERWGMHESHGKKKGNEIVAIPRRIHAILACTLSLCSGSCKTRLQRKLIHRVTASRTLAT